MRLRLFLLPILLAALASAQTAGFTTTQSMQNETRATAALLEKLHISKKDMGSVDMNSVVKTYCENLDGAKMYFTAEEVDEFVNRYGKTLDLYLQRGNLTPAFEIYALFKKKVNERTVSNLAALDQPIDLTQPGTFPVDRKKAEWPANQEAADALWARRLRLDEHQRPVGHGHLQERRHEDLLHAERVSCVHRRDRGPASPVRPRGAP